MDDAAGHRVLDVEPEVPGEDLAAGGLIGYQPPGWRQVVEGVGDDLAEDFQVCCLRRDRGAGHVTACQPRRALGEAHQRVSSLAGVSWPVTAWAPRPIPAYTCGRRVLSISPQARPVTAITA